jgi:hypothetical protein
LMGYECELARFWSRSLLRLTIVMNLIPGICV